MDFQNWFEWREEWMSNYYDPTVTMTNEEVEEFLTYIDKLYEKEEKIEEKCECGSEKIYGKSAMHSEWCPKHEII